MKKTVQNRKYCLNFLAKNRSHNPSNSNRTQVANQAFVPVTKLFIASLILALLAVSCASGSSFKSTAAECRLEDFGQMVDITNIATLSNSMDTATLNGTENGRHYWSVIQVPNVKTNTRVEFSEEPAYVPPGCTAPRCTARFNFVYKGPSCPPLGMDQRLFTTTPAGSDLTSLTGTTSTRFTVTSETKNSNMQSVYTFQAPANTLYVNIIAAPSTKHSNFTVRRVDPTP